MKAILSICFISAASALTIVSTVAARPEDPTARKLAKAGMGMVAYGFDFDDRLPLAFARDPQGQNRPGRLNAVPAQTDLDTQIWANALRPYWSGNPLKVEGPTHKVTEKFSTGESIGITYNGLLHQMPLNAASRKDLVPLLWTPYGKQNYYGALASPGLNCGWAETCQFGKESVGGVHYKMPKEIDPWDGKLYTINLDLAVTTPDAFGPLKDWRTAIFTEDKMSYATSLGQFTGFPIYFAPDRQD